MNQSNNRIIPGAQTISRDGDIVVFIIGAKIHKWWLLPIALPVLSRMQRMLRELSDDPESGLLGVQSFGLGGSVQYWKSLEHLMRYSRDKQREHVPAMRAYFQKVFKNLAVGVWHETFVVRAGQYEALYSNMPRFGMGRFADLVPATGARAKAEGRMLPPHTEVAA